MECIQNFGEENCWKSPLVRPIRKWKDNIKVLMVATQRQTFHRILTSSLFCFSGQFYEQFDGVAMGSPLSPVIAKFMEHSTGLTTTPRDGSVCR
jgi:hypothetical protein